MVDKGLEFKDFYDFLSMELNTGRSNIESMILTSDKKNIINELKKSSPKLFEMEIDLLTDIKDSYNNVLLHKSVEFINYLPSLIEWRIKNPDSKLLSFSLKASPILIEYYKDKIIKNMTNMLEKLKNYKHNKFSSVYEKISEDESIIEIEKTFLSIVDNIMDTPQGISSMLRIAGNSNSNSYMLEHGINASFISMSVMNLFAEVDSLQKMKVLNMGYIALFQNISMMDGYYSQIDVKRHAQLSAVIANNLMLPAEVIDTILNHHSYEDENGILPVFKRRSVDLSEYMRVLLSVNLFMDTVSTMNLDCSGMEINKVMWFLARSGYTQISIVKIFAELFLPTKDFEVLATNYMIAGKCPNDPIIWNLKGGVAPTKFLCQKEDCKYLSNAITIMPQDINFYHNDKRLDFVKKGTYYSCKMMDDLKKKYLT